MAKSVEQQIVSFFEGKGLSRAQAAGIAGNIHQESSFNPQAPGGGLIQGLGGRTSSGTVEQQLVGVWNELNTGYRGALGNLLKTKTPAEAARVFSQQFEKPGEPNLPARERYAQEAASRAGGGGGPNQAEQQKQLAEAKAFSEQGKKQIEHEGFNPLQILEKIWGTLSDPATWFRILKVVGGLALAFLAVRQFSQLASAEA